jgi:hypothetical protein
MMPLLNPYERYWIDWFGLEGREELWWEISKC